MKSVLKRCAGSWASHVGLRGSFKLDLFRRAPTSPGLTATDSDVLVLANKDHKISLER